MSPILGIYASSQATTKLGFLSIATVTVGAGGSSSISFTSIPSTYSHLQIRWIARANNAGGNSTLYAWFNNDTTVNIYPSHGIQGDGSSASAYARTGASFGNMAAYSALVGGTATASIFGVGVIDILDYANTNKNKTMRILSGNDKNGSGYVDFVSGAWLSTSAINRIDLGFDGNAVQYSSFALYGIK